MDWESYFEGLSAPFPAGAAEVRAEEIDLGDGVTVPGLVPAMGSRAERMEQAVFDAGAAFRALSPTDVSGSPITPITTALVLGTAFFRSSWLELLFPPTVPVDVRGKVASTKRFQWPRWGTKHLGRFDTRLGEHESYGFAEIDRLWESGDIETHGLAVRIGMEERAEAHRPDEWVGRKLQLPAHFVRRALEFEVADMLADTTPGNTFGNVTNINAGSEFDNGGDMFATLNPVIERIALAANVDRTAVRIAVSGPTLTSMSQDIKFKESLSGIAVIDRTERGVIEARLAEYLEVGAVERILEMTDETGGREFSDVLIVYTNGPDPRFYDTIYGSERWTALFQANPGFAVEPWREPMIRSDIAAWLHQRKPTVLKADCAELVTNTAA